MLAGAIITGKLGNDEIFPNDQTNPNNSTATEESAKTIYRQYMVYFFAAAGAVAGMIASLPFIGVIAAVESDCSLFKRNSKEQRTSKEPKQEVVLELTDQTTNARYNQI